MTPEIIAALCGLFAALGGAFVETHRLDFRERVAKLEGRVDALEKAR